jgi:hypothetical protein
MAADAVPGGKQIVSTSVEMVDGSPKYVDILEDIPPAPVPDRVSSRQFGLQMIAVGIKDSVDTWIAAQDAATQWAYERSATFVRDDPMMQSGFTALGYTSEQIDAFFTAAAAL